MRLSIPSLILLLLGFLPSGYSAWGQSQEIESAEAFFSELLAEAKESGNVKDWMDTQFWRLDSLLTFEDVLASDILLDAIKNTWWEIDKNTAELYLNLGFFALEYESNQDLALEAFEWVYEQVGDGAIEATAVIAIYGFKPLGNIYSKLGEYPKAQLVLESALRILKEEEEYDPNDLAEITVDLAIAYRFAGDLVKADQAYQEALAIPNVSPEIHSRILSNYAEYQQSRGLLVEAERNLRTAISLLKAHPDLDYQARELASAYNITASVLVDQGNITAALRAAESAIDYGLDFYGREGISREMAEYYLNRARIFQHEDAVEEALFDCQLSLSRLLPGHEIGDLAFTGNPNRFYPENRLWETLDLQGNLLYRQYQIEGVPRLLEASLAAHEAAMMVEAIQLRELAYDESSLQLLAINRLQKNQAIEVACELWNLEKTDANYQRALSVAERSRSLLLLDRRRQLDLMATQSADPALVTEIDRVDSLLATAQVALRDLDQESLFYVQQEILINSLVSRGQDLRDSLLLLSPLYASARFGDVPFHLSDLQQSLPPDVLVASYLLGESSLFVFGISREEHLFFRVPLPSDLETQVEKLTEAITVPYLGKPLALAQSDSTRRLISHELYLSLVDPVLRQLGQPVDRLWIVPDGVLGKIPFALLLTEPAQSRIYAEEPFLIRRMSLAMVNNLTLLYLQLSDDPSPAAADLLCVAPSYEKSVSGSVRSLGTDLPVSVPEGVKLVFHLQEADYLHNRYGGGYLLRSDAREEAFQREVEHYSLLHFSGHAQADSQGLWNFLALEPEPESLDAFTPLWQQKILALRLQAQMVYLSACETSTGKLNQGEGLSSLARAFMYAGAQSVVATLWQIHDTVSLRYAQRFYLNLEQGLDKDKAMQATMISMIEENRPPYAWAPYLVWGSTTPVMLEEKTSQLTLFLLGASVGILIVIVMVWNQRRRIRRNDRISPE